MKNLRYIFALALVGGLVACGDDGGGTDEPTDTGGTDTSGDAGMDAATDTPAPDAASEAGVDAAPEVEICDDGADNDGDDDVDCDDADCEGDDACPTTVPENNATLCADGEDNDGDGATDCDDTDCATFCVECTEGQEERGGECVDVFDDSFAGPFSYVNGLQIPPRGTDAECCFDFNGDGRVDNGLALLVGALGVLGGDLDIEATLEEALADDDIALVFEWGKGSTEEGFWTYLSTNDVDDDGEPDQDFSVRSAGDGIFQILPEALDEFGALVQFNYASVTDGVLTAGPSLFRLNIPIDAEGISLDLDLTIEQATVQGSSTETATGIASVNEEFDIDGEVIEFGGWKLGGVVPLDQIGALLNDLAKDCACAGFNPDEPVITYGDDGTQYNLACEQTPAGECTADDGVICENIALVCSFLPSLPSLGLNDIDTDGNGVGDALSVGIRVSGVGATLADPPVQPGE